MNRRKWFFGLCFFALALYLILLNQQIHPQMLVDMGTYYLTNAMDFANAPNSVTAIYLFYRYYDTLFEAMILIFAVVGVIYLSVHEED